MKRWLSFFLAWMLLLQAVPALAAAQGQGTQEVLQTIRVEGEQFTYANQTPAPASAKVTSSELSGGDHFLYKSPSGPLPESGYIVSYTFNADTAGLYSFVIMASPLSVTYLSPYQIKINDGEYFTVTSSVAAKIGQINSPKGYFDQFRLQPVRLERGENTVSFRMMNGRQTDGRVFFYLDYFELKQLPWGIHGITANAPNHLFEEQDQKEVAVAFTSERSAGHRLDYAVADYFGNSVASGTVNFLEDVAGYSIPLPELKRGHYTVTAEIDRNGAPVTDFFSVVMDEDLRSSAADHPFAMDVAGGFLIPIGKMEQYARALRLAGVHYVRERQLWSQVSPAFGSYNFSKFDAYNQIYQQNGIRVLELNHDTPAWTADAGKKLPNNLLNAYEYAKTAVAHFGSQADWEFWNEPDISAYTAATESADQYAAYMKAVAIGARDSGSSSLVSMGGFAYPPGSYATLVMQNDVARYVDIYNFHGHINESTLHNLMGMPPSFKANAEFIKDYNLTGMPVYASEAGVGQPVPAGATTLSADQIKRQARYLATSTIESLSMGVDKHFWFVFPYYLENGQSYGNFSATDSPYASLNVEAAMTHALGEGIYMGSLTGLPEEVVSHVFRDGKDSIAAVWSESETPVVIQTGRSQALLTDVMGNEAPLASATGSYTLTAGPDVQYLRIQGDFDGLTVPSYSCSVQQPASELSPADRIVLTQHYPAGEAAKAAKAKGYRLDKNAATNIQVDVYNLNSTAMSGTVTGTVYAGWSLQSPIQTVTVEPFSKTTLTFVLTGSPAVKADERSPVVFTGSFNGMDTSRSVTIISSNEDMAMEPSFLVPDYDNASLWKENITDGSTSVVHSPAPGEIQFDYVMGNGDKWAYPIFTLPEDINFADTEGLVFEAYFEEPVDKVVLRSFMYESNEAAYLTPNGIASAAGWQRIKMPWSDYIIGGKPDDNYHLDPEQIRRFSIGMNSGKATNISFKLRNIGVYKLPDTGLYSKITHLLPAHGSVAAAGTAEISADLIQGEIPLSLDTVEVLLDDMPVAYRITDNKVSASVVLASGSHTVTVKAFDATGQVVTAKSTVGVDAVKPVITLLGHEVVHLNIGADYSDAGATATDDRDGDITDRIVAAYYWNGIAVPAISTVTQAVYTVHYNVADSAGNAADEVVRAVAVGAPPVIPDTVRPVIALLGSPVVHVANGGVYTDAGATANDDRDGDITDRIAVTVTDSVYNQVSFNTSVAGTYMFRYNVTDTAGNAAWEADRTVYVAAPAADSGSSPDDGAAPSAPSPSTPAALQGLPGSKLLGQEDLKKDGKGNVTVQWPADKEAVLLPGNLAAALEAGGTVRLIRDQISLELSAQSLQKLLAQAGEKAPEAQIKFSAAPASPNRLKQVIAEATVPGRVNWSAASGLLAIQVQTVAKDGKDIASTPSLQTPVTLMFKTGGNADPELLGVYAVDGDGRLQYAGGEWFNGQFTATVGEMGQYAVLEHTRSFDDVEASHWAHTVITRMAARHIVDGVTDSSFMPQGKVTRAEFAAMLTRLLALPSVGTAESGFADVRQETWYAAAVASAAEAGLVAGRGDGQFQPDSTISREEMAVMLVRAYEYKTGRQLAKPAGSIFADAVQIGAWAKEAVASASAAGLLQGRGDGQFAPHEQLTRAESVQVLYNLLKSLK